jgi:hypothetical protein
LLPSLNLRNLVFAFGFASLDKNCRLDKIADQSGLRATRRKILGIGGGSMKRMIAVVLAVMMLGAGTLFADDIWRDRRDIRRDEANIAYDRRELRRDLYYGNYGAARHERRELGREYRNLNRDRRDLYWGRR